MPYGIFYDTMIHDFDMLRWLSNDEPVEIVARTACMLDVRENPHRDPDTAMAMLRMGSGALVHVNSSFRAVYGYDQRIEAFGESGMLIRATINRRHSNASTRAAFIRSAAAVLHRALCRLLRARARRFRVRDQRAARAGDHAG